MFLGYLAHFFTFSLIQTEKNIFQKQQYDFYNNHIYTPFSRFLIKKTPKNEYTRKQPTRFSMIP